MEIFFFGDNARHCRSHEGLEVFAWALPLLPPEFELLVKIKRNFRNMLITKHPQFIYRLFFAITGLTPMLCIILNTLSGAFR